MRPFGCALALVVLGGACGAQTSFLGSEPTLTQEPRPAVSPPAALVPSELSRTEESLVGRLQRDLAHLGFYTGPITEEFDRLTTEAVGRFEGDLGLPIDGYYDLQLAALVDLARGRAHGNSVWALQSILGALGYFDEPMDGLDSASLGEAIRRLQSGAGLEASGVYGEHTATALLDQYREERPSFTWVFGPRLETPPVTDLGPPTPELLPIAMAQRRLAELGYRAGPADGQIGPATRAATTAFQKREGLEVDGLLGPETSARLDEPIGTGPRSGLAVPRIEIDLSRQIAFVVLADDHVTTLPISSGNGQRYTTESGGTAVAHTPEGAFSVIRVIDGVREAPLGTLYRPLYFHRGWAIHGSGHVPSYPASHGCVRVHRWDQDWLFERVGVGTAVFIYGGETSTQVPTDAAAGS